MRRPYEILIDLEKQYAECNNFEKYLIKTFFPAVENNMLIWDYFSSKIFSYRRLHSSSEFKKVYGKLRGCILILMHHVCDSMVMHPREYQEEKYFQVYRMITQHIGVQALDSDNIQACFLDLFQIFTDNKHIPFMSDKENDTDAKRADWYKHVHNSLIVGILMKLPIKEKGRKASIEAMENVDKIINNDFHPLMKKYLSEVDDDYKDLRKYYLNEVFNTTDDSTAIFVHERLSDEYGYFEITGTQSIALNEVRDRYLGVMIDLKKHFFREEKGDTKTCFFLEENSILNWNSKEIPLSPSSYEYMKNILNTKENSLANYNFDFLPENKRKRRNLTQKISDKDKAEDTRRNLIKELSNKTTLKKEDLEDIFYKENKHMHKINIDLAFTKKFSVK